LNSRVVIEQAKGVLSIRGRVSVDEAFRVLRSYARAHNLFLAGLARAVIADEERALQVLRFGEMAH
jgi:AmiR/NasT family two-component response regulator